MIKELDTVNSGGETGSGQKKQLTAYSIQFAERALNR